MFETHTSLTYDEAFARARRDRAEAFHAMFRFFRLPTFRRTRAFRLA